MPGGLVGCYLFIQHAYLGFIAPYFHTVGAIPAEGGMRRGVTHLLVFSPAHRARPASAVGNLVRLDQRIGRDIVHLKQVVAPEQGFHDTAMLRHDGGLILRHPFLLPVFIESEHHKQLRAIIKQHVLAGVGHVLKFVIGQLHARRTEQAVPQ